MLIVKLEGLPFPHPWIDQRLLVSICPYLDYWDDDD